MTKAGKEGQRKAPILRFKGFTDDWEQRQLNDFGTFHKGKGFSKNDVSSLNGTPVILYGMLYTDFKTHYSVNNISSYINEFDEKNTIFSSGNEIIFPSSGETAVDIARSAAVQDSGIIIGGDLIILKVNSNTELKFIPLIFLNQKYKRKVASLAQGKSIVHIHTNDLKNLEILIPQKSEQTKISNLINYIEKLLALYERKLKLLSRVKKYFLDNLFAKKEYPNLRFKGFTDAWKQRKLSSILIERKDLSTESKEFPLSSFIQEKGVVPKSQRYDRSFLVKDSSKKYKVTKFGDFIYSSNNLDTGSIGLNSYGNAVISPVYSVFSSKNLNVLETNFVNLLFQQNFYKNKMLRFRQGVMYGQLKIKEDDFLKIRVNVPSQTEIKNITNLFSKIESYATLLENKKKQLVQIKSILLNTMFI